MTAVEQMVAPLRINVTDRHQDFGDVTVLTKVPYSPRFRFFSCDQKRLFLITSVPLSLALLCRDFVSSPDSTPSLSTYYKITLINTYRFLLDYVLEQQTMPTHGVNKIYDQYNLNSEPIQMDLEIT